MKRRAFLERIGSILAILGLTEAEWLTLGHRYYQALAAPNSRKLALLVGINQYPQSPTLSGCLNDVELQKELLIHRFGFATSDILTLTEEQASLQFIEAAISDHLVEQAKTDDVVFFHFSGYGSRVKLGTFPETVENALIPVDENTYNGIFVNYLLEETLLLLLRSLSTTRVTAVLDTSYYAKKTSQPLGVRFRARPELPVAKLALNQLELRKQLQAKNLPVNNGIVLKATSQPDPPAAELLFSGFSSGLFTYALTQYLWEATPATTIQIFLSHVSSSIYKLGSTQEPEILTEQKNPHSALIIDNFPLENMDAEGVVKATDEDGKTAELWLGGLPPHVWQDYGTNSRLTLQSGEQLILKSRTGLIGKVQAVNQDLAKSIQVGELVQESVRVLSRNINLTVALDGGLERIEFVDATSAFAAINKMVTVASAEKGADYVFGKVQNLPSRYGLFSLSGELILNTAGTIGEAVKIAVQRLTPKFATLLAAKLWRLTENEGSSRLAIKANLEIVSKISPRVVMQRQTWRSGSPEMTNNKVFTRSGTAIPTVPTGSRLQYRIENLSDRPIYVMLVGLNNTRSAIAFYPWQSSPDADIADTKPILVEIVIPPAQTVIIPQTDTTTGWMLPTRALFCEHQLIFSTSPFTQTLAVLETAKYPTADQQPISSLVNALDIAQSLLQDLHDNSNVKSTKNGSATDSYIFNVNDWASLNFSFQVA